MSAHDDGALQGLQARGDGVHHVEDAGLRLGGADGEHGEILPVGQADEDPVLGRLNVELRPLQRLRLACEPLLQVGEQVGRGCLARFSGVGSRRVRR